MRLRLYVFAITASVALPLQGAAPCLAKSASSEINVSEIRECLNSAYMDLHQATSDKDKRLAANKYLNCLPSTFNKFEALFGFNTDTGVASPLYDEYIKYLNFIPAYYDYFDEHMYITKFVDIGVTAHSVSASDAEELLIGITLIPFDRNPEVAIKALSAHTNKGIRNFWKFTLSTLGGTGIDPTMYSCPKKYAGTKACRILSDIKKRAPPYKPPC